MNVDLRNLKWMFGPVVTKDPPNPALQRDPEERATLNIVEVGNNWLRRPDKFSYNSVHMRHDGVLAKDNIIL